MIAKKFFKKLFSGILWLNFLAMVVVVVLLFIGLKTWLHAYTHNGEKIEVPDLYGMDFRKAMDVLGQKGLSIFACDSTYIKELPAGCVVVQSPEKGMSVKEGRTVYVTINSLTIPRVRIPNLDNIGNLREAKARLLQLEFIVIEKYDSSVDRDWNVGLEYEGKRLFAGDTVPYGAKLTLIVGSKDPDENEEWEPYINNEVETENADIDDFLPVEFDDDNE